MKLIHVITYNSDPSSSRGNPVPTVQRWTGTEWAPVVKILREYGEDRKEHSYFVLGDPGAVYMVQTTYWGNGTTFLNGEGEVMSREMGLFRIGIQVPAVDVHIPQSGAF